MQQKAPKSEAKEKEKRKEKRRSSKMKVCHQNKGWQITNKIVFTKWEEKRKREKN